VGISALAKQVGQKLFDKYSAEELKELAVFKKFWRGKQSGFCEVL
jgi:hypothetical protein